MEVKTGGLRLTLRETPGERNLSGLVYRALCALAVYGAAWGGLCSMASLSTLGLPSLLPGAALALSLALLPARGRARRLAALCGLLLAAFLFLLRREAALDGMRALLVRLFAASAERQAYDYDLLHAPAPEGGAALRFVLLPLGVAAGAFCGLCAGRGGGWLLPLPLTALCAAAAWLGLSPSPAWTLALLLAGILPFLRPEIASLLPVLAAAALLAAAVFLLAPGEHAALSAWDERARDLLAAETIAYGDPSEPDSPPRDREAEAVQKRLFREEETAADTGGEEGLQIPLPLLLAIALTALLLFLPAAYSDHLRKKRQRNRAGLDDPDPATAVRAAFLYALRWMEAGGLAVGNRPFAACAADVERVFTPELRESFERCIPLWREAAYSEHPLDAAQRARMRAHLELTEATVRERLRFRRRLWARYVEAL